MRRLWAILHLMMVGLCLSLSGAMAWQHRPAWPPESCWTNWLIAATNAVYTPDPPPPAPRPSLQQQFRPEVALGEAAFLCWQIGEHPAGSAGERRAARHLLLRLRQMGYEADLQDHLPLPGGKRFTQNVIARRTCPGRPGKIVLGAHYDSVPGVGCVGANDNASGVGVLLEAARLLADAKLPYSLEIVFFGAEEAQSSGASLVGSSYLSRVPGTESILGMISVDMIGRGRSLYLWHGQSRPGYLDALIMRSAVALKVPLVVRATRSNSDHHSYARRGIPSLWLQRLPDPDNHTWRDQPRNLSPEALEQCGKLLIHTALSLEKADVTLLRKDLQKGY